MRRAALAFAVLTLVQPACATEPAPPAHAHAGHEAVAAQAPAATRWAADASLREGMRRVHEALDELRHYEMGHMSADMARDRAIAIEAAGAYMFANCKLEPQADAALHGILVPLLDGARRLHENPADMAALAAMRDAVVAYPRRFDDPLWRAPDAPADTAH